MGQQEFHIPTIEVETGTGGQGLFRLPDPFADQMAWTLDQNAFGRLGTERGNGQAHDRVG